jgi:hypothetical protein
MEQKGAVFTDDDITPVAVPGTEVLYDVGNSAYIHKFQHVAHGDGHILLVPQPSLVDDSDPLRWSKWKKWLVLFNALWYSFNGAVTGPIMAAGKFYVSFWLSSSSNCDRDDWIVRILSYDASENHVCKWCYFDMSGNGNNFMDVSSITISDHLNNLSLVPGHSQQNSDVDQSICYPIY